MATLARLKEARPRRASRPTPHRRGGDGRRRRRHRALLGGAARIAHPSPLGLIRYLAPPPLSHLITTSPSSLFHSYMIWGSPQIRLPVWRRDFSSSKRECQPRIVRDPPAAFCAVRLHKLVYWWWWWWWCGTFGLSGVLRCKKRQFCRLGNFAWRD